MSRIRVEPLLATLVLVLAGSVQTASAQVFGTFSWQMQPYCNKVVLTLTTIPTGFALAGFDDRCGADTRSAASGQAVFNPNGTVSVNFTIVTSPTGRTAGVSGIVNPSTGNGSWTDSLGNTGSFALGGNTPGLPSRPVAPEVLTVADNPNPNPAASPCNFATPPTLVLCGTTTSRWLNGGYGLEGLQIWRDEFNQVHIRGALGRQGGGSLTTGDPVLFILPPSLRPRRTLAFSIGTGPFAGASSTGAALIVIYAATFPSGAGFVGFFNPSISSHSTLFFGELVYSLDQ
jgi:hypothetical protein